MEELIFDALPEEWKTLTSEAENVELMTKKEIFSPVQFNSGSSVFNPLCLRFNRSIQFNSIQCSKAEVTHAGIPQ